MAMKTTPLLFQGKTQQQNTFVCNQVKYMLYAFIATKSNKLQRETSKNYSVTEKKNSRILSFSLVSNIHISRNPVSKTIKNQSKTQVNL